MRIIILAFIISISLHFIAFNKYKDKEFIQNKQKDEKTEKKSDVKFVKLKKQEIKQEINEVEKPIEKVVKKINNEVSPKIKENKITEAKKIEKKIEQKKQVDVEKSKNFQEKVVKEQIVNKNNSLQNSILEDFLSQKEPINKEILNELEKLYGEEYQSFTKIQKAYLEKNLNNFQVITQRVLNRLGYPKLAAKLRIGGVNIVEFMFHPDGSITNLKITSSSGYEVFDKYSLELIEIAYKDYPRPTTSTKLKFNVNYQAY
ncbi:energy transducer TonB [bacterium]|jgi:protein TonB|nr:energy transducer TonB [bacterium]